MTTTMILINKRKTIPTNTKPTTTGTANSSNKKKNFYVRINFILTCYYSGITSSITVFNKWVAISSTDI